MKRKNIYLLAQVVVMIIMSYQCMAQSANAELEDAKNAIVASNAVYFKAFAKGDSSIFIERYAEDCWIMPPNAPSLCGVDAPLEFFKIAYNKFGLRDGRFITIDVSGDGKGFVTEVGFWESYDTEHKCSTMANSWYYGRRPPKVGRCSETPLAAIWIKQAMKLQKTDIKTLTSSNGI